MFFECYYRSGNKWIRYHYLVYSIDSIQAAYEIAKHFSPKEVIVKVRPDGSRDTFFKYRMNRANKQEKKQ